MKICKKKCYGRVGGVRVLGSLWKPHQSKELLFPCRYTVGWIKSVQLCYKAEWPNPIVKSSKNTFLPKFKQVARVVRSKSLTAFWTAFDRYKKVSETYFGISSLFFQNLLIKIYFFGKFHIWASKHPKVWFSHIFEFWWADFEKIMKKFKILFPRLLNFWNGQL